MPEKVVVVVMAAGKEEVVEGERAPLRGQRGVTVPGSELPLPPCLSLLLPVTTAAAARTGRAFYTQLKARPLAAFSLDGLNPTLSFYSIASCHSALWPASPPTLRRRKSSLVEQYVCSAVICCTEVAAPFVGDWREACRSYPMSCDWLSHT